MIMLRLFANGKVLVRSLPYDYICAPNFNEGTLVLCGVLLAAGLGLPLLAVMYCSINLR